MAEETNIQGTSIDVGFPTGISRQTLAVRALTQAQKFGARLAIACAVAGIDCAERPYRLMRDGGETEKACAVVVATGARCRKLDLDNCAKYDSSGIHYTATAMEGRLCVGEDVEVIAGGSSAGQASVFLSRTVRHVHVVVRGDGLAATMSDDRVQRIENAPQITLHPFTEVTALRDDSYLRKITLTDRKSSEAKLVSLANLFLMIGAEPNTDWLVGCLTLDPKGFVNAGKDADGKAPAAPFATTLPRIFAVGGVRSGSVKRVGSGVGEGSVVAQAINQFLNPRVSLDMARAA